MRRYIPIVMLLALGGCMWTTSDGTQVVLTPQNALSLVVDKMKTGCTFYVANKTTVDQLTNAATQAINNSAATQAVDTVQNIADKACPLLAPTLTPAAEAPQVATQADKK